ncbi:MAG: RagB/SusD family nutrient uptake outer membrane protein [Tannerellaceae bacterium]|nr:RagB/SusD family nutrient uptake outer membrane protein [Tannerellaceae bacterium]
MKKIIYLFIAGFTLLTSCDDFIETPAYGVTDEDYVMSQTEDMVVSAYAMLGDDWFTYPFNLWPYGDVISDDAYKGGGSTGDTGDYHHLKIMSSLTSTPGAMDELWYRLYCAISRCNKAIIALNIADESTYPAKERQIGEVRFLRAHFYYKLLMLFRQIPWVDEQAAADNSMESIRNDEYSYEELFGKIIEDFEAVYNILDTYPEDANRVSKTAAAGYLAKCHLELAYPKNSEYQYTGTINKDHMQKVLDYTGFIVTNATRYGYANDFGDIFMPNLRNGSESIFAVQHSINDNTKYGRANWSNVLNAPWGLFPCGWDFHKPSQNLVNAFKTENELPMFDTFNNEMWYPEPSGSTTQKCDPRLFHTVAINGFPYKYDNNSIFTYENTRTPNTYGYYSSLKENVPPASSYFTYHGDWFACDQNDYVIRYTDVMLMRAEAFIEMDQINQALPIINDIRERAASSVNKYISYAEDFCEINKYTEFRDKAHAQQALRWERRLEMAMESSRFFDLRRWGIAAETINEYYRVEQTRSYTYTNGEGDVVTQIYGEYYKDAYFTAGKNEFMPVPYNQLNYIPGLYVQNQKY